MNYKILVACGTGAATSTHVATRIREELEKKGVKVTTNQCRIQDIEVNLVGVDVIVTTSKTEQNFGIPLFNGIPFLTGLGTEQLLTDIMKALQKTKK